jgi:spore germination protein GerM
VRKRTRSTKGTLLIAFLVFAVVLGALVFRKYHTATRKVEPAPQSTPVGSTVVTLFFAAADGEGLVREGREVEIEEGVEASIESVVDELISGPLGSLAPTLPQNLRVLGVRVKGEVAQIDFGRELKEGIPEGSSAEMAAVYSVVDTVTVNFPKIKAVQFLIEGVPIEDFKGHLDLSAPLTPDYTLEKR